MTRPMIDQRLNAGITEGSTTGIVQFLRAYVDMILGTIGAVCVLGALIVLVPWPYALGSGGVALIVLAMVVPAWD